jgi:DNA mismatch repair protein MutS2
LNVNTFRALEFDRIRALLLQQAGSAEGRLRLEALQPLTEPEAVRRALRRTSEGVALLRQVGRQPYHDLPDPGETLAGARVRGARLEPRALVDLASFIEGGVEITRRVSRTESAPQLARLASEASDPSDVAVAIRRALLPSGEVSDDASPRLAEIRRGLVRLRSQLTAIMEGYLRSRETERLLQDRIVTTRNDRYVLLVKADHRGQLPGIIHGSSGSGASLFVEPLPAVELNNDIVSLQDEEQREVARILRDLTARAGERADDLARMATILGELDAVQAMALLAVDMDAKPPEIVDDLRLELVDSRHPLLIPRLAERLGISRSVEPVPVSLKVGGGALVLVVSGPNTGGKTVALKTVGLLALMAQCGLHLPAAEGSCLPVFSRVFADIGDEQSIAENLSTFSAHLAAIVEMTRELRPPSLVLLDEVGAGTDPTEGGALGVAIVDHFRQRGAMVLATTHHGLMKAYAQSTPGVECASFGYAPGTWEPTFRLTLGTPGRSLALEMAERLGLPPAVVQDARARRDDKEEQVEALLLRLEKENAELEREKAKTLSLRAEAEGALARAEQAERDIAAKKRREVETFARELRRRGEEAEARAEAAIRAAVEKLATTPRPERSAPRLRGEARGAIRAAQAEVLDDPSLDVPREEPGAPGAEVAVGTRARWAALGIVGDVLAVHDDGEATLAVSGKKVRVPREELTPLLPARSPAGARAARGRASGAGATLAAAAAVEQGRKHDVPAEINLIGLTVEEALPRVDKLLDDASLSDRREIRVIHGMGAGRLRRAVAELLEGHPHVASWRPGHGNEGGSGATIVELRD